MLTRRLSGRKQKGASVSSGSGRHSGDAALGADHHLTPHGSVITHAQHRRQIPNLSRISLVMVVKRQMRPPLVAHHHYYPTLSPPLPSVVATRPHRPLITSYPLVTPITNAPPSFISTQSYPSLWPKIGVIQD